MTNFRKGPLFAAAIVILAASPACAHLSSTNKLDGRTINALVAPFHGLQQDARAKGGSTATKEAGVGDKRYASTDTTYATADTRDAATVVRQCADAVDTLVQYADATRVNA